MSRTACRAFVDRAQDVLPQLDTMPDDELRRGLEVFLLDLPGIEKALGVG